MITLAMLSWKSPLTLSNTLNSYKYHKLDRMVDQKVIFFQEISEQDKQIAQDYGYEAIGSPNNIGIGAAYKQLLDYSSSDLFLFLENDWVLMDDPYMQLRDGGDLLTSSKWTFWEGPESADVIRLRHRQYPGDPLWTRQFAGKERVRPTHMLDAIHWRSNEQMKELEPEIEHWPPNWYRASSRHANWTNNPTLLRRQWVQENVSPWLVGDVERSIQEWWETQDFHVMQSDGLFTHMRLDR